jgi:hypothetical protein
MNVKGRVTTPLGIRRRHDKAAGVGDVTLIPALLAWKTGRWQWNFLLPISAPTGDYDTNSLANPGLNYWTFDLTLGGAYNNEKIGFNAALHAGLSLDTENHATDYQSGSTFHLDGSVQQLPPAGPGYLGIGAEAFYLTQVTGDSGLGSTARRLRGPHRRPRACTQLPHAERRGHLRRGAALAARAGRRAPARRRLRLGEGRVSVLIAGDENMRMRT